MVSISLLLLTGWAQAQGFSFGDLFGQANKQKRYYEQQIMAYRAFRSELLQGYQVIKNGLSGIRDIRTAELGLHSTYYTSLSTPAPAVKNSSQVAEIMQWETEIEGGFNRKFFGLNTAEQGYIGQVRAAVLNECDRDLSDLQDLLAAAKWQMTDDERLKRLDKIHAAMLDKYRFSRSFCNSVRVMSAQRQQGN